MPRPGLSRPARALLLLLLPLAVAACSDAGGGGASDPLRLPALHAEPDPVAGGRIVDAEGREVLLRASFRSRRLGRVGGDVRRAYRGDLARIRSIENDLLGIDRPQDHALLLRLGELFLAPDGMLVRIVRGNVTVLGPIVAESLESALALIAAATTDLTPHSDVRLLVPARCDDLVRELLVNYKLEIHSLCTYMVRGSWGGVRGYYVPTLFPESG